MIIAQKLTLRISPPKLPCPGTAPVAAINLKFSGNMPRFVLGKVRKFQDPSSSRLGDIQEKPEGWIKTTPPPATNRVKVGENPAALRAAVFSLVSKNLKGGGGRSNAPPPLAGRGLIDNPAGGKQAHGVCDVEINTAGRCFWPPRHEYAGGDHHRHARRMYNKGVTWRSLRMTSYACVNIKINLWDRS